MGRAIRARVVGRVQGVYFRASTKIEANKLDITGWVKNTTHGEVHLEATGSENSIERLIVWLNKGPRLALVKQVIIEDVDMIESLETFDIL